MGWCLGEFFYFDNSLVKFKLDVIQEMPHDENSFLISFESYSDELKRCLIFDFMILNKIEEYNIEEFDLIKEYI